MKTIINNTTKEISRVSDSEAFEKCDIFMTHSYAPKNVKKVKQQVSKDVVVKKEKHKKGNKPAKVLKERSFK